tara:strand:+ start:3659 stop:5737 length:2079 start_codon:yes stop_codon:yes gene_type:complete
MSKEDIFGDICQRMDSSDIEDIFRDNIRNKYNDTELNVLKNLIINLSKLNLLNRDMYDKHFRKELINIKGFMKKVPSKVDINIIYKKLINANLLERNKILEIYIKRKFGRSGSGELPVTVFTSPSNFDCPEDCFYCPDEKEEKEIIDPKTGKVIVKKVRIQPRSYLSTEPGCMRAAKDKFHPIIQTFDRIHALELMGHETDKIRFIILGGTYCYYPIEYRIWFITSLYYACNTYYNWKNNREMKTLEEEMVINRDSLVRVSGITIETRPDRCTLEDCAHFMNCGITTIQVGIQQLDNKILKGINRRCTVDQIIEGTKRILDCGLKLDTHYMFDLPGPGKLCRLSPKEDKIMIDKITSDPNFAVADQWKLYPTATTPHTRILTWYLNMINFIKELKYKFNAIIIQNWYRKLKKIKWNGLENVIDLSKKKYLPYSEIDNGSYLIDTIVYAKQKVHKDTRLNRIIRDIPEKSIVGGNKISNLRQHVLEKIENEGLNPCPCIRCREIQGGTFNIKDIRIDIYKRIKSGSEDYFISFEDSNKKIYGLARLRLLNNTSDCLPMLKNSAIIRELHVYGSTVKTNNKDNHKPQHSGLGKSLIKKCEDIARNKGYKKIFITSGEGVIRYYEKKLNYELVYDDYNKVKYHYVQKSLRNNFIPFCSDEINIYKNNGILLYSIKNDFLILIFIFVCLLLFLIIN